MGCDGGTIPTRGELVRTKKKPEQVSKENELSVKWKHCAFSQAPLKQPIVSCQLGKLYNKDVLIEFLLEKSATPPSGMAHIRGLKDVKELNLAMNPACDPDKDAKAGAGQDPYRIAPYICPVTGLEMNGHYRFCYLLTCGCVFSERALHEVKDTDLCFTCGKQYDADDVIVINCAGEEEEGLKGRMEARQARARLVRKSKAPSSATVTSSSAAEPVASTSSENQNHATANGKHSSEGHDGEQAGSSVQQNGTDCAPPPAKKSKLVSNGETAKSDIPSTSVHRGIGTSVRISSSASAAASSVHKSDMSKDSRTSSKNKEQKYSSIQNDPGTSSAFKSLFNTHATALNQPKAHWVTYNPQYN